MGTMLFLILYENALLKNIRNSEEKIIWSWSACGNKP